MVVSAPSVKMTNDHSPQDFGYQQLEDVLPLLNLSVGQFHKFYNIGVQAMPFRSPDYKIFMKT